MVVSPYRISLSQDGMLKLKAEDQTNLDDALATLVDQPGVSLNDSADLVPCFDLAELERRNREMKRSNSPCN